MANKVLWAPESIATLLSTELNNMANAALVVDGADYDNATNKFRFADFFLHLEDFDAAPTAGGYFELHIFYKFDGSLYADNEEGDAATPVRNANSLHGVFPVAATDGPQNIELLGVPLSPIAFKCAVYNGCGQDLTAVDTHYLKMVAYNEEIQ